MLHDIKRAFILTNPHQKAEQVLEIAHLRMSEHVASFNAEAEQKFRQACEQHQPAELPGIPDRPILADPKTMPRRRLGSPVGRQAMIHAIAHIEFSAINLALDAIQRFPEMPYEYHNDWLSVAQDEAKHFLMLSQRLDELGSKYGDFEAHDGLWHMAEVTKNQVLDRMAIVPRMMEARGLDVNPQIMERLDSIGDKASVAMLETILHDEVGHVSIGNKWFHYCCGQANLPPNQTFHEKFQQYFQQSPKGALNIEARLKAGFTYDEIDYLETMAASF